MPVSKKTQTVAPQGLLEEYPSSLGEFRGLPTPYWHARGAVLYLGDVRACLQQLPARSVQCVVTSPPYWGLRSYLEKDHSDKSYEIGDESSPDCGTHGQVQCGECYVCSLVGVFREVYRVLRDDGVTFLNLGDTYSGGGRDSGNTKTSSMQLGNYASAGIPSYKGLPPGNLVGIPWRVALALQADGWILRQDIIWAKTNPIPESVTNRCTKSHEHIFMLAKGQGYYYDVVAIEEEITRKPHSPGNKKLDASRNDHNQMNKIWSESGYKNKRDVWTVPTGGYPGAHYAVFSPRLITPCILAGTSEHGCCVQCGKPYERVVVKERLTRDRPNDYGKSQPGNENNVNVCAATVAGASTNTIGWRKVCGCQTNTVTPCVVLDPFVGSGTTSATAIQLGRAGVGIDLSETYLRENAIPRIEAAMTGEKVMRKSTVTVQPDVPPPYKPLQG